MNTTQELDAAPPSSTSSRPPVSRSRTMPEDGRLVSQSQSRSTLSRRSTASSAGTILPPYSAVEAQAPEGSLVSQASSTRSRHSVAEPGLSPSSVSRRSIADAGSSTSSKARSVLRKDRPASTASTLATSRTRERLQQVELERDKLLKDLAEQQDKTSEMRRLAADERAVAERLKHEAGADELSTTEKTLRALRLAKDAAPSARDSSSRSNAGLFKSVCSTDLLFLIDTTGSMDRHIAAAKDQVRSIVNDIKVAFFNDAEVRIAVVGYKDHNDLNQIQALDFTPSADQVRGFLDELEADGGGDAPEDVLGGIQRALNLSWKQQTRCIIHIADAPPHGRTLHDMSDSSDNYANPGGEPHGLTHEPLLSQMMKLNINYVLLRINDSTDKMAFTFLKSYSRLAADCKLHASNRYYSEACSMTSKSTGGTGLFNGGVKATLLFQESELGTTYSALQRLVVKSVISSASRTAMRVVSSRATTTRTGPSRKLFSALAAVEEGADDMDHTILETAPPQWHTRGWLDESLKVEGFSPDVVTHGASTLDEMMASDGNIKMSITELTIHKRSKPFAQGAMRIAFYARQGSSTNRFVIKTFKLGGKRLAHLVEDMRCQALCKAFAFEFNAFSRAQLVDFVVTCLKGKSGAGSDETLTKSGECMSLEPFIDGTYVKYNSNCGYVNEDNPADPFNQAAQAFSHFTFERSRGAFLVSDLQGARNLWTDPAVHTADPERFKLVDTNLGLEGIKFFFSTHHCNSICHKLGLKSNASMIMSGDYTFRENWPKIDDTVYCSNKLCGKIVAMRKAKQSDAYPGCRWCDGCWPQLSSTKTTRICVAPGPHHEFEVSRFFYESQGKVVPRRCQAHGDIHNAMSRAAIVNGSFWAKLRSPTKRSTSDRSY